MTPRSIIFAVLATITAFNSPAFAKDKKKSAAEKADFKVLAEFVLKNGSENPIKAPSSKTLGYEEDVVAAKGLRIKASASKDNKEHAVYVTYASDDKGELSAKDMVFGVIQVKETAGRKSIDGYRMRIKLDGTIVTVMKAAGAVGAVKQELISPKSKEAVLAYNSEKIFFLKDSKLEQLTQ